MLCRVKSTLKGGTDPQPSGYEPYGMGLCGAIAWGRITPGLGVHILPSRLVSSGEAPIVPVPLEVTLEVFEKLPFQVE